MDALNDSELITDRIQIDSCWKGFNEFRKKGKFVDLTLILPDKSEFKVHKCVMASGCPYFDAMFDYNEYSRKIVCAKKEKGTEDSDIDSVEDDDDDHKDEKEDLFNDDVVELDREISPDIFEKIIHFIYTGDILISPITAPFIHENAVFFNLPNLKRICTAFLMKSFQIETCLTYWRKSAFNENLEENCFDFIARNCEVFLQRYILDLTFDELKKITSSSKMCCSEEVLYSFVIKWAKSDEANRSEHLKLLLEDLRFITLSEEFKFNIIMDELLNQTLIDNFKQNSDMIKTKSELLYQLNPPRIGFRKKHFVAVSSTSIYNYEQNNWSLKHKHHFGRGFRTNSFGLNYLLFSGGGNDESSKNCQFYCPIVNAFRPFPAMKNKRKEHGILSLQNKIYACGGDHSLNTMEIFDLNAGIWMQGPSTVQNHRDFGISSDDNCIYIVGGGSSIVERFDGRQNKWSKINDVPENIDVISSVFLDDKLYCFTRKEVQILDLRLNEWMPKIDTPELLKDAYFDGNLFDNEIYFCGQNELGNLYSIHKFNVDSQLFTTIPKFLLKVEKYIDDDGDEIPDNIITLETLY